ncbi:hypothetical protein ACLOJK_031144 [Asimina triloba]
MRTSGCTAATSSACIDRLEKAGDGFNLQGRVPEFGFGLSHLSFPHLPRAIFREETPNSKSRSPPSDLCLSQYPPFDLFPHLPPSGVENATENTRKIQSLMDSRDSVPSDGKHDSRPVLTIDLNEIPSPPSETPTAAPTPTAVAEDALTAVRNFFRHNAPAAHGSLVDFPWEPGAGPDVPCGLCGRPESRCQTLVCDGCDRGFHLSCIGLRARQVSKIDDWVCRECAQNGFSIQRWPLGVVVAGSKRSGVRLLDMNASPPSDADGEGNDLLNGGGVVQMDRQSVKHISEAAEVPPGRTDYISVECRFHVPGVDPFSGNSSIMKMPSSNSEHDENRFVMGNASGTVLSTVKGVEGMLPHGLMASRSFEDTALDIPRRDGKKCNSMLDAGHYIGTMPFSNDVEDRHNEHTFVRKELLVHRRRRRKELARHSRINNFTNSMSNCDEEPSSDVEIIDPPHTFNEKSNGSIEATTLENCKSESHSLNIDLPVQYEDFFLLSLGEVDLRSSYHNRSEIWPVGYRSSWHDKITGSLFKCEVLDGGNSGPVFKVRRCPCSVQSTVSPVPSGSTVLYHPNVKKDDAKGRVGSESVGVSMNCEYYDEENDIQMLLSDHSPSQLDVTSCLSSGLAEAFHGSFMHNLGMRTLDNLPAQFNCLPEGTNELVLNNLYLKDAIGEFQVQGRSSSSAWTLLARTFTDTCCEAFKHSGSLQFMCEHNGNEEPSEPEDGIGPVARFRKSSGPIDIPNAIWSNDDLESSCEALRKWLDQDRFGLDMDFIQEIIEQLPGAQACSQYKFLKERSYYPSSQTVGNGRLLVKRRRNEEDSSSDLCKEHKKPRKQDLEEQRKAGDHLLPPGQPLSAKLPAELVGDVFEVWELLWRFYEVLGLKEPLSFEDLEQELLDPWFDGLNFLEKLEKEIQEGRDINVQRIDSSGCCTLPPTGESHSIEPKESSPTFIQVETGSTKEAAQARLASHSFGRCTGVALARAHTSLLKVLISELQSRVAAFVDPNFDAGEPKSRRGRKKDLDNSGPPKKSKIDTLPINELTWPELARRYMLSVIAMDGSTDSAEVASREGGKVFRCLQGDGGILCGSLSGVAGMEADALECRETESFLRCAKLCDSQLLAEAEKQISDFVKRDDDIWPADCKDSEPSTSDICTTNGSNTPVWAQLLEPVKKLPTNVGTRIRKCIYDALEKGPPEWARKILEHSISKEVYKGNASGPTKQLASESELQPPLLSKQPSMVASQPPAKKAVLAVLAVVCGENPQQRPSKGRKEKIVSSMSDTVMKQCRIVLRRAATADDGKVFCNLLSTTLLNPIDNDDEGILGLPAVVSRPLDFRTIDLRLAAGAYGGSHVAFLEDVLSLVQKCMDEHDHEGLNGSTQKQLDDFPASANELPKAPWEEGVCKVCGIDRDDDSVLLCDTCDSEYHTYCLNPPLARIPEGNWYCPSCVSGQGKIQDAPTHVVTSRHGQKRYQGEDTHALSEALNQLAATMEEKEYWELSIDERVFLLKFLCDEALTSAVVREHLDQCADLSAELQQKSRSLAMEWRTLKFREELLTARNAKEITGRFSGVGEAAREGMPTIVLNNGKWIVPPFLNNKPHYYAAIHSDFQQRASTNIEGSSVENGPNDINKHIDQFYLKNTLEKYFNGKGHAGDHNEPSNMNLEGSGSQTKSGAIVDKSTLLANLFSPVLLSQDNSGSHHEQPLLMTPQKGSCELIRERLAVSAELGDVQNKPSVTESSFQNNLNANHVSNADRNGTTVPMLEVLPGSFHWSDIAKGHLMEHALTMPIGSAITMSSMDSLFLVRHDNVHPDVVESKQACDLELNSLKNEISMLQNSISTIESQLQKISLRRDLLGRDSCGRLYWGLCRPGKRPWLVIDGSAPVEAKRRRLNCGRDESLVGHSVGSGQFSKDIPDTSNVSNPCYFGLNDDCCLGWLSCESDDEIQELAAQLSGSDSRERELKESILHWQRLWSQHSREHVRDDPQIIGVNIPSDDAGGYCLTTKAAASLEKKYGSCVQLEANEIPKKKGKKGKSSHEERMYRCECLELVWPSRHHCLSCHQTFCTGLELEGHNEGRCSSGCSGPDENKENEGLSREGKGIKSENTCEKEHDEFDAGEAPKGAKLDFSSRLVKFQKKEVACPYDIEEISAKFITKNSNKELVKEIGLLGSNGNPSFITSTLKNFHDPMLMLIQPDRDDTNPKLELAVPEEHPPIFTLKRINDSGNVCLDDHASFSKLSVDVSSQRNGVNGIESDAQKSHLCMSGCRPDRDPVSVLDSSAVELEGSRSCRVPENSLRPLIGKASQILRQLKINLLDMDAALPEEALKLSKAHVSRRCAWRAFVKSAESIYEQMVQAMIIFENMIKTEYLSNGWWYWSSLTAAVKTSTITSLALRIYALDAAIIYQKTLSSSDPVSNPKAGKASKKRKDSDRKEADKKDSDG